MSERLDIPDFFLYTTLNQNQTKDLRKARTNRDERTSNLHNSTMWITTSIIIQWDVQVVRLCDVW